MGGLPRVQAPSVGGIKPSRGAPKGSSKDSLGGPRGVKHPVVPPSLGCQAYRGSRGFQGGLPGESRGVTTGVPGRLPGASRGVHLPHTPCHLKLGMTNLPKGSQRAPKGAPRGCRRLRPPYEPKKLQDHASRVALGGLPGELPTASWGTQATRDLPKVVGQASPGATEGPPSCFQGLWRGSEGSSGGAPGGAAAPRPPKSKPLGETLL